MSPASPAAQADLLLDAGKAREALAIVLPYLATHPDDVPSLMVAARSFHDLKHDDEALTAAQRLVTLRPESARAWRILSMAQSGRGHHPDARTSARTARQLGPDQWLNHIAIVQADLAAKLVTAETRDASAHAVRLAPLSPDAHFIAGNVALADKKWAKAADSYRLTLSMHPEHTGALNNLALAQLRRGRAGTAVSGFAGLLATDPASRLAQKNLLASISVAVYHLYIIVAVAYLARMLGNPENTGNRVGSLVLVAISGLLLIGYIVYFRITAGARFGAIIRAMFVLAPLLAVAVGALLLAFLCALVSVLEPQYYDILSLPIFAFLVTGIICRIAWRRRSGR